MKMTPKRVDAILSRYNELLAYARQLVGGYTVQFDDAGNIEKYVNTACHCHPEYEWIMKATKEQFLEFLQKNNY